MRKVLLFAILLVPIKSSAITGLSAILERWIVEVKAETEKVEKLNKERVGAKNVSAALREGKEATEEAVDVGEFWQGVERVPGVAVKKITLPSWDNICTQLGLDPSKVDISVVKYWAKELFKHNKDTVDREALVVGHEVSFESLVTSIANKDVIWPSGAVINNQNIRYVTVTTTNLPQNYWPYGQAVTLSWDDNENSWVTQIAE